METGTEKVVMHYLDDDVQDMEHFKDAVCYTGNHIVLHTYTKAEELMRNIHAAAQNNAVVLLDINMPRKNGFEILKEIREKEEIKNLPVVIYSASKNKTAIDITKDLGANLYVVKPHSFNDLRCVIETISSINWHERDSGNFLFNLQVQ